MSTFLRGITLMALFGCTTTAVTPGTETPSPTAPLPPAETLCYRGMRHFSAPDGSSLGSGGVMVRRTVDPAASRIVQEVIQYHAPDGSLPVKRLLEATVEGDRFTIALEGGTGSGSLRGDPWAWISWASVIILPDGTRVVSEDEASGRDIAFHQQVLDPSGTPQMFVEGVLLRIQCEEWETLAPLALSGQLISDMQVP